MDTSYSGVKSAEPAFSSQHRSADTLQFLGRAYLKRPLANKKECVQFVLQFLSWKDYYPCSAKELLRSPSLQVLLNIWNFLFRMVDENANITKQNMATEVPKFFREFGYPQIMKTSHLRTPTADHQWESNLVALSWLCKLLIYEEQNFDKKYNVKAGSRFGNDYMFRYRGKTPITNAKIAKLVTELTAKHYQLYIGGDETGKDLMDDFEDVLNTAGLELQESVNSKIEALEYLRNDTLKLQDHIHSYNVMKERVRIIRNEVKKIDDVTESLKKSCLESEQKLRFTRESLAKETDSLKQLEKKNKEMTELIDSQNIDRNEIRALNQTINSLKAKVAENEKKIKDCERNIPLSISNITKAKNTLCKHLESVSMTQETLLNYLANNDLDSTFWKRLPSIKINLDGTQKCEILGVSPELHMKLLQDTIAKDADTFKSSRDAKQELTESIYQLENLCNSLNKETASILRETSTLIKNGLYDDEHESQIQLEATELANMIEKTVKEEIEKNRNQYEIVSAKIVEVTNKLKQQEDEIKKAWIRYIETIKDAMRQIEQSKASNCRTIRELINYSETC